jgi:hypothetical protein
MVLRVLSLDLDWFNPIQTSELPVYLEYFFRKLAVVCELPREIAFLLEHHYLYPWCARLVQRCESPKVSLVNIDAHHDFYGLNEIKDFTTHKVTAANFLAFMAHDGMLHHYTWVTNRTRLAATLTKRPELQDALAASVSARVRSLRGRVKVRRMLDVWDVLERQRFDAFAIVTSPRYARTELIQKQVSELLNGNGPCSRFVVTRDRRSREFKSTDSMLCESRTIRSCWGARAQRKQTTR